MKANITTENNLTNQTGFSIIRTRYAGVAELADAPDLGSGIFRCAGSIPVTRTKKTVIFITVFFCISNPHIFYKYNSLHFAFKMI